MTPPLIPSGKFVPTTSHSAEDISHIINDISAIQRELLGDGGRKLSLSEIFESLPKELPAFAVGELGPTDPNGWDPANEIGGGKNKILV